MFVSESPEQPAAEAPIRSSYPDLEGLPLERLEHEICQLASGITAGMARWLSLVGEFDRREGWAKWWGCKSTAHWVAWRCAISARAAREHVRVPRVRCPDCP